MEQLDLFQLANEADKEEKEEGITERQKALYNLIYHNSMVEHRKTHQREIVTKLAIYGYQWTESENTSDHCSTIWSDVAALNLSFENDNVIITKNYVYWIGSKEETEAFLRKLWKDLAPRLHRYWFYVKKVGRDGQGKLFDKYLQPIFENEPNQNEKDISDTTRLFHKCFLTYDITMQHAIQENKKADKELNAQGENQ